MPDSLAEDVPTAQSVRAGTAAILNSPTSHPFVM
ncbi:hypothetical protein LI99_18470 [Mycolicibacterium smegmatis]|uniref:Uncharacterized protein n=2 Tax=Mycolicibacterium smegmatis (strain ATCC 700084 / mc(2)155) TaxID=246196 RepID=I7GAB1_MYCS2|nr:hypothetical protein MSMEG_3716 [Mycolicibacterium smegmatis MC2 155]AIU15468.1 hypothetical protein LI99_18470 [Mycolicibacterium smegmatis]AFP40091.1 hypothetical protein MSMEI_3628 [Mycolicibacterium smegmatis MC2 155]AIU08843.1 hypothetical protein LJ00_18465 [Mycolicibacterium smegmatis MC2 155]AIU22091.1 hypothetical protein LI98_18475 [Mycolicibacterium smegmatis]